MLKMMKTMLTHDHATALEDVVGAIALFVLLFAVLSMPGMA